MTIGGHAAMRFWLRPGGLATTTTRGYSVFLKWQGGGLIGLSTKTLRSVAPSSTWAASYLHPSSAAFITTIAESSFQYTHPTISFRLLYGFLILQHFPPQACVAGCDRAPELPLDCAPTDRG